MISPDSPPRLPTDRQADIARLLALNRQYVKSAQESDGAWYRTHLAEDYLCSYRDCSIIGKDEFLARIVRPCTETGMATDEVQVQFAAELALVHAVFKYQDETGRWGRGRYTDIYTRRNMPDGERWVCVAAHFNCF